jgi:hypothetical protein
VQTVTFFALETLVNFDRGLCEQEQATADQDKIASGDGASQYVKKRVRQPGDPDNGSKSRMRMPIAARSPIRRAGPCCDPGSLLDRMEMKITSVPSLIAIRR